VLPERLDTNFDTKRFDPEQFDKEEFDQWAWVDFTSKQENSEYREWRTHNTRSLFGL
jgi:hypothetical protein